MYEYRIEYCLNNKGIQKSGTLVYYYSTDDLTEENAIAAVFDMNLILKGVVRVFSIVQIISISEPVKK